MGKPAASMTKVTLSAPVVVEARILAIRGERVLLDRDLAQVYGVSTKALNQGVRRNQDRFPDDFRFQITPAERDEVVTHCDRLRSLKFASTLPWAFTEHGAIMAASVLSSQRAVQMSVFVVRAFIRLRALAIAQPALAAKLRELESRVSAHDQDLLEIIKAIRQLTGPPTSPRRRIGFVADPQGTLPKARVRR
jgi:hypothetical protein